MFGYHRRATSLCPNLYPFIIRTTLQTPKPSSSLLLPQHFSSFQDHHSFTVNYLIKNCRFSPETASRLSNRVHLDNSERPDSVLSFFKTHGFSNTQIFGIIRTCPKLLSFDPNKTILPKFNFFLSKGASTSDLVHIVTKNPVVLLHSLDKTITPSYDTPSYDFLKRFLLSDQSTINSIKYCACLIYSKCPTHNVQVLLQNGVPESKVALLFRNWYNILAENPCFFEKVVKEVKELGFNPNTTSFVVALRAKVVRKSHWEEKIDSYTKWGWSEDIIVSAFLRNPWCMLASKKKIETMMKFFVNQMGWESLMLAKHPILLMLSLEKRVIPRAFVLQFLESRGLIKDAKSATAFRVSEEMFLKKFVNHFKEDASQLLKLYEEKKYCPS